MNILTTKYRFAASVLLAVILSHIALFHFEMEQTVLCIDEGRHIHIENIVDSHINNDLNFNSNIIDKFVDKECTDYKLDNYIDEIFSKPNKLIFNKLNFLSIIKIDTFNKYNHLPYPGGISSFINNIPLDSYSTISLLI